MQAEIREQWQSQIGFLLSSVGSIVGLGTLWRLPYVMGQNGGGAFILVFLLCNLFVGIPLFAAELVLGRVGKQGSIGIFTRLSAPGSSWASLGWLNAIGALLVFSWYSVVAGWGFHYMLMSLTDALQGKSATQVGELFDLFRSSGELNVLFQVLFLATTGLVVLPGIASGIERYSRFMSLGLFAVLLGLVAYSCTLKGFSQAVRYALYPNFAALTTQGALKALGLSLFSLSLGFGMTLTYGSYMQSNEDIPKISLTIGVANLVVTILIALMIFPMIFTFGFEPEGGEGLVFKTLPFVFAQLPGSLLVSLLFFVLLLFTALTSSVAMLEAIVANLMDIKGWSRGWCVLCGCAAAWIVGLPTAIVDLFPTWTHIYGRDFFATIDLLTDWMLIIAACFTSLFVGWKLDNASRRNGFTTGSQLQWLYKPWLLFMRFIVPCCVISILFQYLGFFQFG